VRNLDPDDPARRRDLTKGHHLPNLRPDRQAPHRNWLPRQRRGTTPQMVGRYPDFDVLESAGSWDHATKSVVMSRLSIPPSRSFFSVQEEPTLRAFCDCCMAQDAEPRIPVAEMIDEKLAAGRLDGYQYADMPDDRDTWHLVLAGLDEQASARYGHASFAELGLEAQKSIVADLAKGQLSGGSWERLNVTRAWSVCMRMILSAFYSHPWAWNEIGFGGPAYPRGFMRLGPTSTREPFERPPASDADPVREDEEP
jgi:hypothetical protein